MLSRSYHAGMEPASGAPSTSAESRSCLDSTIEYLLLEMIRYYSVGQDHVAAVHAVETTGFRIGSQLAERLTTGEERMDEPLVKMRFICKQFWTALFGRQVGGLKTNHKGRFVLDDSALKWLAALKQPRMDVSNPAAGAQASTDERSLAATRKTMTELYVALACSSIKGALSHLNMPCSVMGSSDTAPACAKLHLC